MPLNDRRVEKSSFHGCCRLGTRGGSIATFKSCSFGEGQKGIAGRDGTENVTTISDTFPAISGTFTTFPMLCSCDIKASSKRHKAS